MSKFVYVLLTIIIFCDIPKTANALTIVGQSQCNDWTKERAEYYDEAANDQMWLEGYLSGMVYVTKKDVLNLSASEALMLWVDQYCKAHQLDYLNEAGNALFLNLKKQKGL